MSASEASPVHAISWWWWVIIAVVIVVIVAVIILGILFVTGRIGDVSHAHPMLAEAEPVPWHTH